MNRFQKIIALLVVFALGYFSHALQTPAPTQQPPAPTTAQNGPRHTGFIITPQRRQHILVGNETGGGHKFGAGKPGKTEFPQSWDDDKIITAALSIANDEKIPMRPSGRYWLKASAVDGVFMRVVLNPDKGEVITAYPLRQGQRDE